MYAPLDANVWKVNFVDGNVIRSAQVVVILEAMKMEVSVSYDGDKRDGIDESFTIEKVLVQPGDTVRAGDVMVFLRRI
jgi:Pyruvate carboxylase